MVDENEIGKRFGERLQANAQAEAEAMQAAEKALAPVTNTMKAMTSTLANSDQGSIQEDKLHRSDHGRYEVSYILETTGRHPHTLRFFYGPALGETGGFIWVEGLARGNLTEPAEKAEALANEVERFVTRYFAG